MLFGQRTSISTGPLQKGDAVTPESKILAPMVADALSRSDDRVQALQLPDGRRFWLKRIERLSGRMRLQKGDPAQAFEAEREGLEYLAAKGMPVPEVVLWGDDYFVLPDAGPTLVDVAARADGKAAFEAAGKALGLLHWAGLVHGRPAVRDICWDGEIARFIDLERFKPARRSGFWQAMDVLIFSHSVDVQWGDDPALVEAALRAYDANSPDGAMARARRLAKGLFWLSTLAWLILQLKPKSRDIRAYSLTLTRLRNWKI